MSRRLTTSPDLTAARRAAVNPAVVVVLLGSFTVSLDTTMSGLALPRIGDTFGVTDQITWLVTAKLLALGAALPMSGWLADRFGRKRTFEGALWTFAAAALVAAIAPSFAVLLACRVVQGFGTGIIMPVGMTMLLEISPRGRQGRVLALWTMANQLAPAFGPPVGGLLAGVDWRWIFVVSAGVAVVCSAIGMRFLPDIGYHDPSARIDLVGVVLATTGLFIFVFGLNQSGRWGWSAPSTVACLSAGLVTLAVFVVHALRVPNPVIELRLFRNPSFALSVVILAVINGLQMSRLVFIPLNLQDVRGMLPSRVGLLFLLPALLAIVASFFAGRVTDRIGPKRPIVLGMAIIAAALAGFANFGLHWPIALVLLLLCLQSTGFGTASPPANLSGMGELAPSQLARGSAIRAVVGQVGAVIIISVMSAVIAAGSTTTAEQAQDAYNTAFLVATLLGVGGLGLALLLPSTTRQAPTTDRPPVPLLTD